MSIGKFFRLGAGFLDLSLEFVSFAVDELGARFDRRLAVGSQRPDPPTDGITGVEEGDRHAVVDQAPPPPSPRHRHRG
jgi:hypothetical protein